MPGKKKATGLSKRQSFLDRNVIAENKAIMRFNEALADAARGVERATGKNADAPRPARPARPVRQPRPARPVLPPEEEAALRTAVSGATEDPGVVSAGSKLVEALGRGDRFERAAEAGWRLLSADPGAADRDPREWDRLRAAWGAVRRAALAQWVTTHPDAAPLQEKEAKAAARAERAAVRRPAARRTRPPRRRPEAVAETVEVSEPGDGPPDAAGGPSPAVEERRRRSRGPRRPRGGADRTAAAGTPTDIGAGAGQPATEAPVAAPTDASDVDAATPLRPPVVIRFPRRT